MTNQEILTKAMEKAIKNGLKIQGLTEDEVMESVESLYAEKHEEDYGKGFMSFAERGFIFNHDFAKTFWKPERETEKAYRCKKHPERDYLYYTYCGECGSKMALEERQDDGWKTRLQEMVLEVDPIKYLEKYL